MKRSIVFLSFMLCGTVAAAPTKPRSSTLTNGDAIFAAHLHAGLKAELGNLFYSPASVRIALAMAYAGARGDTASEMQRVLSLPPGNEVHAAFGALLKGWDDLANPARSPDAYRGNPDMRRYYETELARRRIVLRLANRLWADQGYHFRDDFLALLRDAYRAPLEQLPFKTKADHSRLTINKWVSDKTEGKVNDLLGRNTVTADTRLVLTNAVYLKASWSVPFEAVRTSLDSPFHVSAGKEVKAPLMRNIDHYRIASFPGGQMVELPYASGEMVMDVVLPAAINGLDQVEAQFTGGAWSSWVGGLKEARVDVMLPRFKATSAFSLKETLSTMGLSKAFVFPAADFSGMDGSRLLYLSDVIHKAFVSVDENGTEAAAATAVMMAAGGMPPSEKPLVFRADHPFLFILRDTRSGTILFVGRLVDPTEG